MERQASIAARFRTLTESAQLGVLATDENGSIRFCSARAAEIFACAEGDILGAKVADLVTADGLSDGNAEYRPMQATGRRLNGEGFPIDLTVISVKVGSISSLVWIVHDRTARTFVDAATKLPDREFSIELIRSRLEQAVASQTGFALLIVGLEGLDLRDRHPHGHDRDAVFAELALRLRHGAPGADFIGRIGDAEFCILLSDGAGAVELELRAQTLVESLSFPIEAGDASVQVTPRAGVALVPADGASVETLLQNARAALDRAKREQSAVQFYSADVAGRLTERRGLQQALRGALDANRFALEFLPLINLETGDVSGAEALLRWTDPERGQVPPAGFIAVAEESGLMVPIGQWVVREALRNLKRWNDRGRNLRVAVNMSPRQLHAPGFVRQLGAALNSAGCKPNWLEVELTEATAMQHAATVQMLLADVRNLGVKIALDDFGTGYSSMAYLKSLPVDIIKIDRSFVDGVPHDNDDSSIVRAVIAFALCTGREPRCEGVTSIEQARWLHAEGCESAQGFFFSKPIPAAEFDAWLTAYEAESPKL